MVYGLSQLLARVNPCGKIFGSWWLVVMNVLASGGSWWLVVGGGGLWWLVCCFRIDADDGYFMVKAVDSIKNSEVLRNLFSLF